MNVAIPVIESMVSQRFDCARAFVLVRLANDTVSEKRELQTGAVSLLETLNALLAQEIDIVICGSVSRFTYDYLRANGVKVFPLVRGDVESVIEAMKRGEFDGSRMPEDFAMLPFSMRGFSRRRCCRRGWRGRKGYCNMD